MRRLTSSVLVVSMLGVAGSDVVSAQVPSPDPVDIGGRVEVPAAGFALTLPEDWLWVDTSSGDIEGLAALVDATDPERGPTLSAVLTELAATDRVPVLYAVAPIGPDRPIAMESCTVTAYQLSGDSVDERMAENETALADTPGASVAGTRLVDLPAGTAGRFDHAATMGFTAMGNVAIHGSEYYLTGEMWELVLICLAADPPEDYWLSIAETIEFLPEEE